jgi:hypothetical protein
MIACPPKKIWFHACDFMCDLSNPQTFYYLFLLHQLCSYELKVNYVLTLVLTLFLLPPFPKLPNPLLIDVNV